MGEIKSFVEEPDRARLFSLGHEDRVARLQNRHSVLMELGEHGGEEPRLLHKLVTDEGDDRASLGELRPNPSNVAEGG